MNTPVRYPRKFNRQLGNLRKTLLALSIQAAFAGTALAMPVGPVVVHGQVSVATPDPGKMVVGASNNAIINWKGFSIGSGELVRFAQPGASSAVLNRVVGGDASRLLGALEANGKVFLINPNGIVIGAGARIDTNGFLASTLNISDDDFLAGRLRFAGDSAAGIENHGFVRAGPNGQVILLAPNITNSGIIQADDGRILLAAGHSIEIASLDNPALTFRVQAPTDSVLNLGRLLADNGAIGVFAGTLRQAGEIRANRLERDADGSIVLVGSRELSLAAGSETRADGIAGGSVSLQSDGSTELAGTVSAVGGAGAGGRIEVLGGQVAVTGGASVDASGAHGGGTLLVGGDFQGKNPAVANAQSTYIGDGASLRADATQSGDGGRIIVWADENTRYFGSLSAQAQGAVGDGGFAEVSGKQGLQYAGSANLLSVGGKVGTLLLDPLDIIVSASGGLLTSIVDQFADFAPNVATVSPATLAASLSNVVLQAERHIYFNDAVTLTRSGLGLTAMAGGNAYANGNIYLNQNITTAGGAVSLHATGLRGTGSIATAGGAVNVELTSPLSFYDWTGGIASAGGAVTLSGPSLSPIGTLIDAGSGNIAVNASAGSISYGSYLTTGNVALTASGSISNVGVTAGMASLAAGGSVYALVSAGDRVNASSTGSSITLTNLGAAILRLGSVSTPSTLVLSSASGLAQAAGGVVEGGQVYIYSGGQAVGSAAAPLLLKTANLWMNGVTVPAYLSFDPASPALSSLSLDGSVSGLASLSLSGPDNLTTWTLGSTASGILTVNAIAASGTPDLFLRVGDGGLSVPTLSGFGDVTLYADGGATLGSGSVALGNVAVGSLYVDASGAISATGINASAGGVSLYANACYYWAYAGCAVSSPITVGNLGASGNVTLQALDNGDVTVNSLTAGNSISINAGATYYNSGTASNETTGNDVVLGSVAAGNSLTVSNNGQGDVVASGNLQAASWMSIDANRGRLQFDGNVSASNGVSLSASNGDVPAMATIGIAGELAANGTFGTIDVAADGNILFETIAAGGSVELNSATGNIRTSQNDTTADIVAGGNVSLSASDATNGSIGNTAFANPLDIKAGSTAEVSLVAGRSVGAAGKTVNVDTNGSIAVTSSGGQFHVSAKNAAGTALAVSTIRLSASAAGVGNGGSSVFSAQNLSVSASSDGSTLSIGDIVQTSGTLNEFRFEASGGSGFAFGNANLASDGDNRLYLSAGGDLTQGGGDNVAAGHVVLAAGGGMQLGDVSAGNLPGYGVSMTAGGNVVAGELSARSLSVSGADLLLGAVTSTGTVRATDYFYVCPPGLGCAYLNESMVLSASGELNATALTSATSANATAGAALTVAGNVAAGSVDYRDMLALVAGSSLSTGTVDAYRVTAEATSIASGAMTATSDLSLSATNFSTGNLSAGGSLGIAANGSYAPSVISLSGNTLSIVAPDGIDLNATSSVTANSVNFRAESGNVLASDLIGTSNVYLTSGGYFNVGTSGTLLDVDVTAAWNAATSGPGNYSSVYRTIDAATQAISIQRPGGVGTAVTAEIYSPSSWNVRYTDAAAAAANFAVSGVTNGGSIAFDTPTSGVSGVSLSTGGAWLDYIAGGNVLLDSLSTDGGAVNVRSTGGNIAVGNFDGTAIATIGGAVTLTADSGSILRALSSSGPEIDTATFGALPVPAGSVTLHAVQGSVGSASESIRVDNTLTLNVAAKDTTNVEISNSLANLTVAADATGSGSLFVRDSGKFDDLTLTRTGGAIEIGGGSALATAAVNSFSVRAENGSLIVANDIGNVSSTLSLTANGTSSDIVIGAAGGPRSVTAGWIEMSAGRDILVAAGAGVSESVVVEANASAMTLQAGRDIRVTADGGSAALISAANQVLVAGGALEVSGGSSDSALAEIQTVGVYQSLDVGGNLQVIAGTAGGAYAQVVQSAGGGSQFVNVDGNVVVRAGAGDDAYALMQGGGYQSLAGQALMVEAGAGDDAYAAIRGGQQSFQNLRGGVDVAGGAGIGSFAEIAAVSSQYIGSNARSYTDHVKVVGGAGSGAYASISAGGSQTILAAKNPDASTETGDVEVLGGTGSGAYAEIATTGGQSIGTTDKYCFYYGCYDPTQNVRVVAGSGGVARIVGGSQTILGGGDIQVLAADVAGMTASIESTGGGQTIGSTYIYASQYDATDNIVVRGGAAGAAAAWIKAAAGQTIDAGGTISVEGGNAANSYAEIANLAGSQSVGNLNSVYYDQTDAISVVAGSGARAEIRSQGAQTVRTAGDLTVAGGNGVGAGASLLADGGQAVQALGNLNLTGGTGVGAGSNQSQLRNNSGSQSVSVGGNLSISGGGSGSDVWIYQTASGSSQTVTVGGDLSLQSSVAGNNGVTSIESLNGSLQTLDVGGAISVTNTTGWVVYAAAYNTQTITADSISVRNLGGTFAGLATGSGGTQNVFVRGTGVSGSAMVQIENVSGVASSGAAISADGDQTLLMDYASAGAMQIGTSAGQGRAYVASTNGSQEMVVGSLTLQGGSTVAATAELTAVSSGAIDISTIAGELAVLGGSQGAAFIDPQDLSLVANGSITLQGGAASSATATITATNMNMAATNGNVFVSGGSAAGAAATVSTSNINLVGSDSLIFSPSSGGASISSGGSINLLGSCVGCDTGLSPFGSFLVTVPPSALPTDLLLADAALVDLVSLLDSSASSPLVSDWLVTVDENGETVIEGRRILQCF